MNPLHLLIVGCFVGCFVGCLGGCFRHVVPANATLAGLRTPVLLGPQDRIGAGIGADSGPLPTRKVGRYEGTSKHASGHNETTTTITDWERVDNDLKVAARDALAGRPDTVDIRLTEIKPQAVGAIVAMKARVDVEGDIVEVTVKK